MVDDRTGRFIGSGLMVSITMFLCPSDQVCPVEGYGRVNYRFNIGPTVFLSPGYNVPLSFSGPFTTHKFYRPADFSDGLSNTVGISERAQGDWLSDAIKPRGDYKLLSIEPVLSEPTAEQIQAMTSPEGDSPIASRGGESWFISGFNFTNYNHAVGPNHDGLAVSFSPNTEPMSWRNPSGIFPATSFHPGGVQVATFDGSVHFVTSSVDLNLWKSIGTRVGRTRLGTPW